MTTQRTITDAIIMDEIASIMLSLPTHSDPFVQCEMNGGGSLAQIKLSACGFPVLCDNVHDGLAKVIDANISMLESATMRLIALRARINHAECGHRGPRGLVSEDVWRCVECGKVLTEKEVKS